MNESRAITAVEEAYGSLEDLVYFILSEHPEVLEDNLPLAKTAALLNLDPNIAHFLLSRSGRFRMLVRADLVNREFSMMAESAHIHEVVKVATNQGAERMTAKGDIVSIDHMPSDIMAAGKYLNDYRGTSLQQEKSRVSLGVQVNFIGVGDDGAPIVDVEAVESDAPREELPRHRPARAGDLPPPDARQRYALADGRSSKPPRRTGDELDFYSAEADEEARDSAYEKRTASFLEGERADIPSVEPERMKKDKWGTKERLSERMAKLKSLTPRGLS